MQRYAMGLVMAGAMVCAATGHAGEAVACEQAPCAAKERRVNARPEPASSTHIAADAVSGRLLVANEDKSCASRLGLHASADGGRNWTRHCMKPQVTGFGQGTPSVAFDAKGQALAVASYEDSTGADRFFVQSSTDGGQTWGHARLALTSTHGVGATPRLLIDKQPASPFRDSLYLSYFDAGSENGLLKRKIGFGLSLDGGLHWERGQVTSDVGDSEQVDNGNLAVGGNGALFASYLLCHPKAGSAYDCTGQVARMMLRKSVDGGRTWGTAVTMATVALSPHPHGYFGGLPNTDIALENPPIIAIDSSDGPRRGALYAAMTHHDGKQLQIVLTRSMDGGQTWSAPSAVVSPLVPGDRFMPWIDVSADGVVGVTWLDRRGDSANVKYQPFAAISMDGGQTFSDGVALSPELSDPFLSDFGGLSMGTQAASAWDGNRLRQAYMGTRSGSLQTWQATLKLR